MESIDIGGLDDRLIGRLHVRAARHGRSMHEEARVILCDALDANDELPARSRTVYEIIRDIVEPYGGFRLPEIKREPMGKPPHV